MYSIQGSYELRPAEADLFAPLKEVSTLEEWTKNRVVLNTAENGLLAGDRIQTRLNPHRNENIPFGPGNPKYIHWLTDDYNAVWSVRMAESQRITEAGAVETARATAAIIEQTLTLLPKYAVADEATRARYKWALESLVSDHEGAYDPRKQRGVRQAAGSAALLASTGKNIAEIVGRKVSRVFDEFSDRARQLDVHADNNKQRDRILRREGRYDDSTKELLRNQAEETTSIAADPGLFLRWAKQRKTKPGNLTMNNAWLHREAEDSWSRLSLAMDGFEGLYGPLMKPMSQLARETLQEMEVDPETFTAVYKERLGNLEDVIDLAHIGHDYDPFADRLQELNFTVEECLLNGNFKLAIETAKFYRFFLHYRALPGGTPPEEWYTPLPDTPIPVMSGAEVLAGMRGSGYPA